MAQYVSFLKPPVVEVVCGVRFDTQGRLKLAHIGAFWASLREAFPVVEEVAPIIQPSLSAPQVELSPRSWLIAADGSVLMQIQKDWFLLNWKKSSDEQPYPSYEVVKREFDKRFKEFTDFLSTDGITWEYRNLELTYVNHISKQNGLERVGEWRLLIDHARASGKRFLPDPTEINWRTSYPMPDGASRLNVTAQTGRVKTTGERIVRLDLQATGLPSDAPQQHMDEWFEMAHEWIIRGFADITTPELHEIWERKV